MYETPEITSFYGADDFMGTGNSKGIVVIDPVVAVEVAVATVAVAVEVDQAAGLDDLSLVLRHGSDVEVEFGGFAVPDDICRDGVQRVVVEGGADARDEDVVADIEGVRLVFHKTAEKIAKAFETHGRSGYRYQQKR